MTTSTYLENVAYNRLLDALMVVDRTDLNGQPDTDGYKLALGEFGDIWPESIREEAEDNQRLDDAEEKRRVEVALLLKKHSA